MLGQIIRWKRLMAGWSMNKLAKKIHITIAHLSNIEKGRRKPSIEVAIWISEIFNIPAHFPEIGELDNQTFYTCIKQVVLHGKFEHVQAIRKIQRERQLTAQQYLISDIFVYSFTVFERKKKRKEINEFLYTIYLNKSLNDNLRRAALYYLLIDSLEKWYYDKADKYINKYIELIHPQEQEERVCMLLKRSLIQWKCGVRGDLLRTLLEVKEEIDTLETADDYLPKWNYLYALGLLYHGFVDEAAGFLEKNIQPSRKKGYKKSVIELISQILLFSYTDRINLEVETIAAAIKQNSADHCFMLSAVPYIYTMASSLLKLGKTEEAKQIAALAEAYPLTNKDLLNRLFYLLQLNIKEKNKEVVELLGEKYIEEESRITANPYQAIDVCKLMIAHFEEKNQYKKASRWGQLATKITTTYFGTLSLT